MALGNKGFRLGVLNRNEDAISVYDEVVRRFRSPEQVVSYLVLNPRVKQSGGQPASHGRITKQGRAHARGMLVEAAWAASKTPGPLRAFYERVRGRRGMQIAVVATARKLAVLCWTMIERGEDYAFARPSLTDSAPRWASTAECFIVKPWMITSRDWIVTQF